MYLMVQWWGGLLVAGVVGLAVGFWVRKISAEAGIKARVATIRADSATDLVQLRNDLEDLRSWHAREIDVLGANHQQTLDDRQHAHEAELRLLQEAQQIEGQMQQTRHAAQMAEQYRTQAGLEEQNRQGKLAWLAQNDVATAAAAAHDAQVRDLLDQTGDELRQLGSQVQALRVQEQALGEHVKRLNASSEVSRRTQVNSLLSRHEALDEADRLGRENQRLCEQIAAADLARTEFESNLEDLQEQLLASRKTLQQVVATSEAKEERLSVELIELRAELERLRHEHTEATRRKMRPHRPSGLAVLERDEIERLIKAAGAGLPPLPAPLDGRRPDDLKLIDGINPGNEQWLHGMGIFFFWQIAAWTPEEAAWVRQHLPGAGDELCRLNWMAQGARLATPERVSA